MLEYSLKGEPLSEDLTKKLPMTDSEKRILTVVENLDAHVRSSIESLVTWVGNIDSRLKRLEEKVEQRLYDTRPIWHKVVADIAQLQAGQQRLEQGLEKVRSDVSDIRRDQIVLNDSIRKIQLDFHNIDQRLYRLEVNRITPN